MGQFTDSAGPRFATGGRFRSIDINALVPVPSPEDRDYARLLVEIEARKRRIVQLQAERDALELALSRFAVQLKGRVGVMRSELNRVKLQVAEYRRRIERLKEDESIDPQTLEEQVAAEFAEREEQARAQDEQAGREGTRIERRRNSPRLDAETEAEILRIYRELAKRFHPDLARTEAERKRRAALMLKINVAYSERDLLSLQTIAREAESVELGFTVLNAKDRLVWANRVILKLDGQIEDLEGQLGLLMRSETYALWQSPETSQQSVQDLEARVRQRLTRERDRLDEAILDYNRILRRRRMPRAAAAAGSSR